MGLRVIQYQGQSRFTAVEECPLLMETNPSHSSLDSVPLFETHGHLCPLRHAEAFFVQERNGGNAMTCPHKENWGPIFALGFKSGVSQI